LWRLPQAEFGLAYSTAAATQAELPTCCKRAGKVHNESMVALGTDYVAWTEETARKVRERRFDEIDLAVVAEEIESLGSSERGEVDNRLTQLLLHLLKWNYQPD